MRRIVFIEREKADRIQHELETDMRAAIVKFTSFEIAAVLAGMKDPLKSLMPLLGDKSRAVRRDAAWTLYYILMETSKPVAPKLIEALGHALGDRDPHVSHAIASALGAYVSCLKTHYVEPSVISEIILPARENIRKYGHNRSPDELLSGLLTFSE